MAAALSSAEQDRFASFFDDARRWCQAAEARDDRGEPVAFSDQTAVAWDVAGALCRLFGWARAAELFPALARHVPRLRQHERGGGAGAIDALVALQNWNDDPQTTHADVAALIRMLPVQEKPAAPFVT
jgi:hypothetical protein